MPRLKRLASFVSIKVQEPHCTPFMVHVKQHCKWTWVKCIFHNVSNFEHKFHLFFILWRSWHYSDWWQLWARNPIIKIIKRSGHTVAIKYAFAFVVNQSQFGVSKVLTLCSSIARSFSVGKEGGKICFSRGGKNERKYL